MGLGLGSGGDGMRARGGGCGRIGMRIGGGREGGDG